MAEKKKALGRGLDALFGEIEIAVPARAGAGGETPRNPAERNQPKTINNTDSAAGAYRKGQDEQAPAAADPENAVLYIDIDDIRPNEMQPRQAFEPESIDDLAASIEAYGVIQPVLLRRTKLGYELIAGERRWRAARKAGLRKIPAILREVTEEENALIAIIENMQREDLNPLEEASAFRAVIEQYGMTQEALSRAVGKSRPHIANTLRLLKLPPEIQEYLRSGALTLGHANALGAVRDSAAQIRLAGRAAANALSVRETERLCAAASDASGGAKARRKAPRKDAGKTAEIRRVEEELTSLLGTKVVISGDRDSGCVELRYYGPDELDGIVEFLREAGEGRG